MLLHTLPVVSAQAQPPPPDYTLICEHTNTNIEVDPNTPNPPEGSAECTVQNHESYAIELSIETELELVETQHVNSIEIQGNSEETFEVSLKAEDEMLMMNLRLLLKVITKVTKTGGFDYSDDESRTYSNIVNILQYAGFSIEAHQSNEDVELIDGEELQLSYTITNTGNGMDSIIFNSRSYATPVCDETKRQEINDGGTLCELSTPVSDDCDEELVAKNADNPEANVNVNWMLDVGESFTRTISLAGNMKNTSCWPTDSNGDYNLVFTQQTRVISDFQQGSFSSSQGFTGNNNWTTIEKSVDVTMNNERGIINSVVPGFEVILALVATCVALVRRPIEQYSQTK